MAQRSGPVTPLVQPGPWGLPFAASPAASTYPDCVSLRGAAGEHGHGLCSCDKRDTSDNGSRAVDPLAWPRAAPQASPCDHRPHSRHLQPQQARALGRVQRRGPSSLQQRDASRQRPIGPQQRDCWVGWGQHHSHTLTRAARLELPADRWIVGLRSCAHHFRTVGLLVWDAGGRAE